MERELMLYCVEGGVGHDAYVAGKGFQLMKCFLICTSEKMKARCLCGNGALMVLRL